ncbi:MAG: LPS assembly lipoprotein LptE [Thiohalobacteraceae bacterium]
MHESINYVRYLIAGFAVVMLIALSGCGFHLRGEADLAPELAKVYFEGGDPYDPLVRDWTRALTTAGSQVVEAPKDATAIVQILANRGDRRVLSVRATGKVQEYELYQTLQFRVRNTAGIELLEAQQLQVTRDYLFDATDVLGKTGEEESLRRDMRRDLVRLAMLRLEALGR